MRRLRPAINTCVFICSFIFLAGCSPLSLLNLIIPESGLKDFTDIAYGDKPRQRLDVYQPAGSNRNDSLPVIIFFYGGRWSDGNKKQYLFMAETVTRFNAIAVIPDYRLYPDVKFPVFVEDAAKAVLWVQQNIHNYHGNPKNIFLMGHSAGAHIAAMLALNENYLMDIKAEPVLGMIGLAGPYDFLPLESADLIDMFGPPDSFPDSQPINFVGDDEPPLLLMHGADDKIVYPSNTIHLRDKLLASGNCVHSFIYPDTGHISLLLDFSRPFREDARVAAVKRFVETPDCD